MADVRSQRRDSYEERAKLRREKRKAEKANSPKKNPPSSLYFDTRPPFIQPPTPPTINYISEYDNVNASESSPSLNSPLSSQKPHERSSSYDNFLTPTATGATFFIPTDNRNRAVSEPPTPSDIPQPIQGHPQSYTNKVPSSQSYMNGDGMTPHDHGKLLKKPLRVRTWISSQEDLTSPPPPLNPVSKRPYESRTPRLVRGANTNKTVYRKDLSESHDQDITVVMFTQAGSNEKSEEKSEKETNDVTPVEKSPADTDVPSGGKGSKKSLIIIPNQPVEATPPPPPPLVLREKKDSKKVTRRLSLFGGKSDEPKDKEKDNKKKKLSSRGLSKMSLPNLYKPTSPEVSSDNSDNSSPIPKYSFFKKKPKEKQSHKTGWKFHSSNEDGPMDLHSTSSELYLSVIGEEQPPSYDMATRTMSMIDLAQPPTMSFSDDMNPPITIFHSNSSHNFMGDSDNDSMHTAPSDSEVIPKESDDRNDLVHSSLSLGSISVEIVSDNDPLCQSNSPQPTVNEITCGTSPMTETTIDTNQTVYSSEVQAIQSKVNIIDRQADIQLVPLPSKDKDRRPSAGEDTTLPKEFKRFVNSRKPVRKQSINEQGSPALQKRSPSLLAQKSFPKSPSKSSISSNSSIGGATPSPRATPTFKSTGRGTPSSPFASKKASPKTTPTPAHKKNSPNITPTNSPKTTPIASHKLMNKGSPQSSPKTPRKGSPTISHLRKSIGKGSGDTTSPSPITRKGSDTSSKLTKDTGPPRKGSGTSSQLKEAGTPRKGSGNSSQLKEAGTPRKGSGNSSQLIKDSITPVKGTGIPSISVRRGSGTVLSLNNSTTRKTSSPQIMSTNKEDTMSLKEPNPTQSQKTELLGLTAPTTPPASGNSSEASSGSSTPTSRRRRIGVSAVTSPLAEDRNFQELLLQKEKEVSQTEIATSVVKGNIVPKRPAPAPPGDKKKKQTSSKMELDVKEIFDSVSSGNESTTTPIPRDNTSNEPKQDVTMSSSFLPSKTPPTTTKSSNVVATYVYQSTKAPLQKVSEPFKENNEIKTFAYVSQGRTSTSSLKNKMATPNATPSDSKSPLKVLNRPTTSPTSKKPPSGAKIRTNTSSPSNKPNSRLSIPTSSLRSKSEGKTLLTEASKEKPASPKLKKDEDTLAILNPVDSLITVSSPTDFDKGTDAPLSPPVIASMLARPFSPISPSLSQEEFDLNMTTLTPEVPVWSGNSENEPSSKNPDEARLTYIYRSTILRKSSKGNGLDSTKMSRTPSNKSQGSPRHEAKGQPSLSRTGSPRKSSLPPSNSLLRQSKRSLSNTLGRKNSTPERSSIRRPSSGVSRLAVEKSGGTGTLTRPRSASLAPTYPSLRRGAPGSTKSKSSSTLTVSKTAERTSMRGKKITDKPPTGRASTKDKKIKGFLTESTSSGTDTSSPKPPVSNDSDDTVKSKPATSTAIKVPLVKSKKIDVVVRKPPIKSSLKTQTSDPLSNSELRRSIRKSQDGTLSKQAANKPPTGISHGRTSIQPKQSIESLDTKSRNSSIRLSRRSSAGTISKGSSTRGSTLKRGAAGTQISPSHKPLSRGQSQERDETTTIFDDISSMAQKNLLSSVADHKLAVRPLKRQKPSSSHLQMLSKRKDVSSELQTVPVGTDTESYKVDPNTYSTYMGKKVLDRSALVGLAAKLDFTTVKLRKTGIVDKMMADQESTSSSFTGAKGRVSEFGDAGNSYGVQLTSHPIMLLMIKGRKQVQTRLVQPLATSVNSGDVFILVKDSNLFLWQGKDANVIEKARGNDLVNRIHQKKELGCRSNGYIRIEDNPKSDTSKNEKKFWDILQGKQTPKKDAIPNDEVYERGVTMATKVYQYNQEGETGKFTLIHEDVPVMPKIAMLDSKKILLFDFYSEVYIWIGKHSTPAHRKQAMLKARKFFDSHCAPPSFGVTPASPARKMSGARSSGRRSSRKGGTLNSSIRRKISRTLERKASKTELQPRPDWALFTRVNEGSETILFREKFSDWPEPGRIIKMKGHQSSGEVIKPAPMPELQPADVSTMLKPRSKFEGLRLEGENVHRGRGNYKVTRSTFACNRVRTITISKWHVKEFDNILIDEANNGLFYSGEGYVIRWGYVITVVRELEGLTPGQGMFARDRQYQKELEKKLAAKNGSKDTKKQDEIDNVQQTEEQEEQSSDEEVDNSDEECQRILESGGRDRCAYFFWQGEHASVNEKGAAAVMTVELDKEKGPQIRVVQGKEHPAFLQLFNGSMIILLGKSENNAINMCPKGYRFFYVGGAAKKEAYLLEVNTEGKPLSYHMRSRGCYIIQHKASQILYVWMGNQTTEISRGVAKIGAKRLRKRLGKVYEIQLNNEDQETNDLRHLLGDEILHYPLTTPTTYTPRLFHLSSSTGWFIANEESHIACPDSHDIPDPFPFLQEDIYNATQPCLFLMDAHLVIYLWMGWWPQQKNKLLQERNAFSGTAQSRWATDKKLALQTALNYAKESQRSPIPTVYVVNAGTEHLEFTNLFPYWREDPDVKAIVSKDGGIDIKPSRTLAETELARYLRTSYTLDELKKRPEEVNPLKLETYLSDQDFQTTFKMTKEEFTKLAVWKQENLKKAHGLF